MAFGEDALSNMMSQGLEELRAANSGAMAEGQPIEAPQAVEPSGYEAALNQAAQVAEVRAPEMDMGIER